MVNQEILKTIKICLQNPSFEGELKEEADKVLAEKNDEEFLRKCDEFCEKLKTDKFIDLFMQNVSDHNSYEYEGAPFEELAIEWRCKVKEFIEQARNTNQNQIEYPSKDSNN